MRQPYHQLRHPMMFYYGHPAVLYINKFRVAGLLEDGIDLFFEQVRNHSQSPGRIERCQLSAPVRPQHRF